MLVSFFSLSYSSFGFELVPELTRWLLGIFFFSFSGAGCKVAKGYDFVRLSSSFSLDLD